ncbi:TRAFs-binding domain-containing protein [Spirosoma arboris]|nr:TRAFs-binding domain-containing protein [Spirosoma arboris]
MNPTVDPASNALAPLRPICFMIMPYGKKPTQSESGVAIIDYDALWDKALFPLIDQDLNYYPVRADQDLGAMIIKEMIERLALADLVIADVSTPNANVYYEIGVRHAARETGCVMISADWSKQLFDISQMRQVRYPLPEGTITDETAAAVREKLKGILPLVTGISPVFDSLPGFPSKMDISRTTSFRGQVEELSRFSTEVRKIRLLQDTKERSAQSKQLIEKYKKAAYTLPGVALEIIYLLRDNADWAETLVFLESLPDTFQSLPVVKEQTCLVKSKNGSHIEAIAALKELIATSGDSSERRGLIGGRYKKLFNSTKDNPSQKSNYLDQAIAEYTKGMMLDLNDYFPSCNLPRLLRTRNEFDDGKQAQVAAIIALAACERKRAIDPSDEWLLPTLLGLAFDAGDINTAQNLYKEMRDTGVQPFKLETTVPDLETAISLIKDETISSQLTTILLRIKALVQ